MPGSDPQTSRGLAPSGALGILGSLVPESSAGGRTTITLARLILHLGDGVDRFDEAFARTVAKTLDEQARHLRFPFIERVGLEDVVATLYMDKDLRLVVTGNHASSFGAVSVRWDEQHFPFVEVELAREPIDLPYTFATLDFSVRGKKGTLLADVSPFSEGQKVTIRALATIGGNVEYRVVAMGQEVSVAPDELLLEG